MLDLDQTEIAALLRVAYRIVGSVESSEEVVQSALLEVLQRPHDFESIHNWHGFLRSIVTRRSIDYIRKKRHVEPLNAETIDLTTQSPVSHAIYREQIERLRLEIGKLSQRQAEVFTMRFFAELDNDEIAKLLNISSNAVAVLLKKAKHRLSKLVSKEILG